MLERVEVILLVEVFTAASVLVADPSEVEVDERGTENEVDVVVILVTDEKEVGIPFEMFDVNAI